MPPSRSGTLRSLFAKLCSTVRLWVVVVVVVRVFVIFQGYFPPHWFPTERNERLKLRTCARSFSRSLTHSLAVGAEVAAIFIFRLVAKEKQFNGTLFALVCLRRFRCSRDGKFGEKQERFVQTRTKSSTGRSERFSYAARRPTRNGFARETVDRWIDGYIGTQATNARRGSRRDGSDADKLDTQMDALLGVRFSLACSSRRFVLDRAPTL